MVGFCALGLLAPVADGFVLERYEAVACELWCVAFGHCVSFVVVMLLAPLLRCGCFQCVRQSEVCVPHTSDLSVKAAGHRKEVETIRLL